VDHSRVPAVRIVPPWTGNPSWGSKTDQSGLLPNGKYLTLAEVKTEDEETQVMTVTIGGNTLINSQGNLAFGGPISAMVEFGTAGGVFSMLVDVFVGTQFSIAASWIRVSVLNEAFMNPVTISQLPVQASASVSLLPVTKANPITKTITALSNGINAVIGLFDTPLSAPGNLIIPIQEFLAPFSVNGMLFAVPPFAKSLIVHASRVPPAVGIAGARSIGFLTSAALLIGSYSFVAGEKQTEPVSIPNGTVQIIITNDDFGPGPPAFAFPQRLIPQFFLQA
jgi:hypothetical protein